MVMMVMMVMMMMIIIIMMMIWSWWYDDGLCSFVLFRALPLQWTKILWFCVPKFWAFMPLQLRLSGIQEILDESHQDTIDQEVGKHPHRLKFQQRLQPLPQGYLQNTGQVLIESGCKSLKGILTKLPKYIPLSLHFLAKSCSSTPMARLPPEVPSLQALRHYRGWRVGSPGHSGPRGWRSKRRCTSCRKCPASASAGANSKSLKLEILVKRKGSEWILKQGNVKTGGGGISETCLSIYIKYIHTHTHIYIYPPYIYIYTIYILIFAYLFINMHICQKIPSWLYRLLYSPPHITAFSRVHQLSSHQSHSAPTHSTPQALIAICLLKLGTSPFPNVN